MARATYHQAADGFPARNADTWTEEKLMILGYVLRGGSVARAGGSVRYALGYDASGYSRSEVVVARRLLGSHVSNWS